HQHRQAKPDSRPRCLSCHCASLSRRLQTRKQSIPLLCGQLMSATLGYTTNLQAGLGLVAETKALLEIWKPGMSVSQLNQHALDSGRFPQMTARRLRNLVVEGFAPRYLVDGG